MIAEAQQGATQGTGAHAMATITNAERYAEQVIRAAEESFYAALAAAFPACRTGDMTPLDAARFSLACRETAAAWLTNNVPA